MNIFAFIQYSNHLTQNSDNNYKCSNQTLNDVIFNQSNGKFNYNLLTVTNRIVLIIFQTSSLNLLDDDDYPSPQLTATSSTISDIVTTTPVTLYDEPETLPRDSPTIIALPDVLRQFEHSLNPIEICSSHHVRLTCQYVYQSAELTLVFFIINQSPHTITELQLVPKLPSNLKPVTSSTVNFHSKSLDSMTSCLHALSIGCNSPALNMVLSGNLIYR